MSKLPSTLLFADERRRGALQIKPENITDEGLFVIQSFVKGETPASRFQEVMTDSINQPGPSKEPLGRLTLRRTLRPELVTLRESRTPIKSCLRSPSITSFESAESLLGPAETSRSVVPIKPRLMKMNSAPSMRGNVAAPPLPPPAGKSEDDLTQHKHTKVRVVPSRLGLRGALMSVTPGYIREVPRTLALKRQLSRTPGGPSTSDSLYFSWRDYFRTPDPFITFHHPHMLDSIKTDVSGSIWQFVEEIEYDSSDPNTPETRNQVYWTPMETAMALACPNMTKHEPERIDKTLVLNVGGECFMVKESVLQRYPDSLLASPKLEEYFVESLNCYFFNRSRFLFEYILQFYQCGYVNLPPNFLSYHPNKKAFNKELKFFKLTSQNVLHKSSSDFTRPKKDIADEMMEALAEGPGWSTFKHLKLKLYIFLTNPQSSAWAMLWVFVDMLLVLLSITALVVESEKQFRQYVGRNKSNPFYISFMAVEIFSQIFFTLDFILRLFSWPRLQTYFKNGINCCDVISLLPYYIPQLIKLIDDKNVKSLVVLRVIRMFRLARVFRIVRHSHGLVIICQFLFNSGKELVMLAGLFSILTLIFSSVIYFVEEHEGTFSSIPASAWWAVVTITGIGYGDVVPKGPWGMAVAATAIMTGVIFLALPMTIIITKFTKHMDKHYNK